MTATFTSVDSKRGKRDKCACPTIPTYLPTPQKQNWVWEKHSPIVRVQFEYHMCMYTNNLVQYTLQWLDVIYCW